MLKCSFPLLSTRRCSNVWEFECMRRGQRSHFFVCVPWENYTIFSSFLKWESTFASETPHNTSQLILANPSPKFPILERNDHLRHLFWFYLVIINDFKSVKYSHVSYAPRSTCSGQRRQKSFWWTGSSTSKLEKLDKNIYINFLPRVH